MSRYLSIDIETFSSVDLKSCGIHPYTESPDFEILILAYSLDEEKVRVIDVYTNGIPKSFIKLLLDPNIVKVAHNATFERTCFNALGYKTEVKEWVCTAIMSAYCGLPLSLHDVSHVLKLGKKSKDFRGRALISYFSIPCKPKKANDFRTRNLPEHAPADWITYQIYCGKDVIAEKAIHKILKRYKIPQWERENYIIDQEINDRGVLIYEELAQAAKDLADAYKAELQEQFYTLTGVANPKSPIQVTNYLESKGYEVESTRKEYLAEFAKTVTDTEVSKALEIRAEISKSSTAKFKAMLDSMSADGRARGTFQFYGARTGRWAGRRIQLQNMTKDKGKMDLESARMLLVNRDFEAFRFIYPDVQSALSQLVRTAIIAPKGKSFLVADFSAIEARVLAWIAQQMNIVKVFEGDGKIYEATAAGMFNVPMSAVTKTSDYRKIGKVCTLAFGYQGAIGAYRSMEKNMIAKDEWAQDSDIKDYVTKWRDSNPQIVNFWNEVNNACIHATRNHGQPLKANKYISVVHDGKFLIIRIPSERCLFYPYAKMGLNKFGGPSVQYYGQKEGKLCWLDAYGGSFTENIVQALARDLLVFAIRNAKARGFDTVLHVHDELATEVDDELATEETLNELYRIMCILPGWAKGLPLAADGFISKFYKK